MIHLIPSPFPVFSEPQIIRDLLKIAYTAPIPAGFLSPEEHIKVARQLVQETALAAGLSDEDKKTVIINIAHQTLLRARRCCDPNNEWVRATAANLLIYYRYLSDRGPYGSEYRSEAEACCKVAEWLADRVTSDDIRDFVRAVKERLGAEALDEAYRTGRATSAENFSEALEGIRAFITENFHVWSPHVDDYPYPEPAVDDDPDLL